MLWSTHIDTGVEILKRDPSTRVAAAATIFCSAGIPDINGTTRAGRLQRPFSFVCAFHQHRLPNNGLHWTMSWVDVHANAAMHFDSLWDTDNDKPLAESLQTLRLERHNKSKRAMEAWLEGSVADFHRSNAPDWMYQIGSKAMQNDTWSCGLQLLEVLRSILLVGGRMEKVRELTADEHKLSNEEKLAWFNRFREYERDYRQ